MAQVRVKDVDGGSKSPTNEGVAPLPLPDRRRWFVLAVFLLLSFTAALQWICFATVFHESKLFFSMTTFEVNMLAMISTIDFPLIAIFVCVSLERLGLRGNIRIGCAFNVLGAVIKIITPYTYPCFAMLFLAQLVNSCVQISLAAVPAMVAAQWFPLEERTLATSIGVTVNNVGIAFGMLVPPLLVEGQQDLRAAFGRMFAIHLALSVVGGFLSCLLPAQPRSPPSVSAAAKGRLQASSSSSKTKRATDDDPVGGGAPEKVESSPLLSAIRGTEAQYDDYSPVGLLRTSWQLLRTVPSFRWLTLATALGLGASWALSTLIAELMAPFGAGESVAGWAGFASLVGGTVLALSIGTYVDRRRTYKRPMALLLFGCGFSLLVMLIALILADGRRPIVLLGAVVYSVSGSLLNAVLPIFYEYGLECTYPAPESVPSTILTTVANVCSFVMTMCATFLLGDNPSRTEAAAAIAVFVGLTLVGATSIAMMKPVARRHEYEREVATPASAGSHAIQSGL